MSKLTLRFRSSALNLTRGVKQVLLHNGGTIAAQVSGPIESVAGALQPAASFDVGL